MINFKRIKSKLINSFRRKVILHQYVELENQFGDKETEIERFDGKIYYLVRLYVYITEKKTRKVALVESKDGNLYLWDINLITFVD